MSGWSQNRFRTRDHNSTVTYYGSWFRINGNTYWIRPRSSRNLIVYVLLRKIINVYDTLILQIFFWHGVLLAPENTLKMKPKEIERKQFDKKGNFPQFVLHFTSHNWGSKKNICLLDTKQTRDEFQENHHDFRHFAFFLNTDTDVLPLRTKSNKRSPSKVSRHEYGKGDCLPERCVLLNRWTNGFTIQNHSDGGKIIFKSITLPSWNP